MRHFYTLILALIPVFLLAQNGPGGVGSKDGSNGQPENVIWFAADALSLSNSSHVFSWTDISGNSNDAIQPISGSQPTFLTGQLNGLPAVEFDGSNDFMPFNGNLIASSDYTVIFVGKRRSDNSMRVFMGGTTSATNKNLHLYWYYNNRFRAHQYGNDLSTNMVSTSNPYSGGTTVNTYGIFATLLASSESTKQRRNYQNNKFLGSRNKNTQLISWDGAAIARYSTGYHPVDAAEVIIYKDALNDAQLQIVNQYLEVKYGITINNDLYTPDAAYVYNVAGIGQESNGAQTFSASAGMYIKALSSVGNGDYIFTSHNNATNSSSTFNTSSDVTSAGAEDAYNRVWYIEKVNTPDARISFDFHEALSDGQYPKNYGNYVLLYRAGTSGAYTKVQNADGIENVDRVYFDLTTTELKSGYYTLGTEDEVNSPLEGAPGRTWYTLISGDWDNWEVWTLDPSGALPVNPDHETPSTSVTSLADNVVILAGKEVTVSSRNNISKLDLTVYGQLDFTTTTGHSFSTINGSGRIVIQADNFPAGDASNFFTKGQGQGTLVLHGTSFNLSSADYEFYDVELDLDDANQTVTLLKNLTVNGDLNIIKGKLQINDNSSTNILNVNVGGNVNIRADGSIITGTGDTRSGYQIGSRMPIDDGKEYHSIFHQFKVAGSFINYGTVKLTNLNAPDYNSFPTNGAVTLSMTGASNTDLKCYGTTNIYNLIIDKGTDKTYILNLYSDNTSYFNLFGANNVGRSTALGYTSDAPLIRKALFIKHGTLKLTGSVIIPSLSEGNQDGGNGDYAIGSHSRLWIAGTNSIVYSTASNVSQITGFTASDTYTADGVNTGSSNQAMSVYGEFELSDGFFGTRNSAGFIFWTDANAQVKIEGGEVDVAQVRSSGASGVASYVQTGGLLRARGNETEAGEYTGAYPLFGLVGPDAVFQMSGGEILLRDEDGDNDPEFSIESAEGNYNVTGGKLTIDVKNGRSVQISSTANLYNLDIINHDGTGNMNVQLESNLKVTHDLTLNPYCTLDVEDPTSSGTYYDVNIGRNFSILEDGNSKNIGVYDYHQNTTTFDGTEDGEFYVGWNHNDGHEQYLWNLTVNKTEGKEIKVVGDPNKDPDVVSNEYYNRLVHVVNDAYVQSGIFNQGRQSMRLFAGVTVDKKGQLGTYIDGTTPMSAYVMFRDGDLTINSEKGAKFGNIKFNSTGTVTFTSDVYIKRIGYYQGLYNIGTYNLKVDYLKDKATANNLSTNKGSTSKMIYSACNATDGGLSLLVTGNGTYGYILGTKTTKKRYTPASMVITNFADTGYVTIRPVDGDLKTTNLTGGDLLSYYWRVGYDNFTNLPTVSSLKFTYAGYDVAGVEGNYVAGKVLDVDPFTRSYEDSDVPESEGVNVSSNKITFNGQADTGFTLEKANYTAGVTGRFTGTVDKYYSYYDGSTGNGWYTNWSSASTWDKGSVGSGVHEVPSAGSVVYIQDEARVWGNSIPNQPAKVIFEYNTTHGAVDQENVPRLQFNKNTQTYNLGIVSGTGMVSLNTNANPSVVADFGEFANNPDAFIMYWGSGGHTLSNIIQPAPKLMFESDNFTINQTITANSDFILTGGCNVYLKNDLNVGGNLYIGAWSGGTLHFPKSGSAITVTVDGNIDYTYVNTNTPRDIVVDDPGVSSSLEHTLIVKGDINHGSGNSYKLDLFNASNRPAVILDLQGESDNSYYRTSTSVPDLYRVVLNKGASQTNSFTFSDNFNINGPTSGAGVEKAIELQNGTLIMDDPAIDVSINTGDDDFEIPTTACLDVKQGTVKVSGDNTGIKLYGKLKIDGGTVNMATGVGNGNNYIEYGSSGDATIDISSGTLSVGSQIRRQLASEEGILVYNQTGGDVEAGIKSAPENTRGVFEILNTGSSFTQTGGNLYIANAQTNASIASLYLDPETSNLTSSGNIYIGSANTLATQTIGIYSNIEIPNLTVTNSSTNRPTAKTMVVPLTVSSEFTVESGGIFNANGVDLIMKGNFTNNGIFYSNENTTYFNGSGAQAINGAVTFYDLTKTTTNTLTVNHDISVSNNLYVSAGTVNDGDNDINVKGDIYFEATHVWGGSSNGIVLNGSTEQLMSGAGVYGRLTIDNSQGVSIDPSSGSGITITDVLTMNSGVFDIDRYLLLLDEDAYIEEGSAFSASNMIQTNISFTDAGIKKVFPAISSTTSYTFPIGSEGKYTPIRFDIDAVDAGGSIRLKGANEIQPTILDDHDECDELDDTKNVLQYHWILQADGITNFTGKAYMTYDENDALYDNTFGYDVNDYIAARLLTYGDNTWNKYDYSNVDNVSHQLTFTFSGNNSEGISGDYTAGIEEPGGCNGAIPNEVTQYITTKNGNWDDVSIWDTYPTSGGSIPVGGPKGAIAIVDHTLTINSNYKQVYKIQIDATGVLKIGSTYGHRLGIVQGDGTIYVESGDLPAGIYDDFFSSKGGNIEFAGSTNYYVLSNYNEVHNLIFSGTGIRYFPNNDITVGGNLTFNGPIIYHRYATKVNVYGDVTASSGYVLMGYYNYNSLVMCGSGDQTISGDFSTGNKSISSLVIDKPSGKVTISGGNVDIHGDLTLTRGIVTTSSGAMLELTPDSKIIGGSDASFIDGPLYKDLNANADFTFPVGVGSRMHKMGVVNPTDRTQWIAQFASTNPYPNYNTTDLQAVDPNAKWSLEDVNDVHPHANITLHWIENTGVTSGSEPDLRVCVLDGSNVWQSYGNSDYSGDTYGGYVTSATQVSFSTKQFTLGTSTPDNPLPVSLIGFDAKVVDRDVKVSWTTLNEKNNDHFVVEKSKDGVVFNQVKIVNGAVNSNSAINYSITDNNPYSGVSYYRLRQVDLDGKEELFPMKVVNIGGLGDVEPQLNVYPNPYSGGKINVDLIGFSDNENALISIGDITGHVVWQDRIKPIQSNVENALESALKDMSDGFYVIILTSGDKRISSRIVKK